MRGLFRNFCKSNKGLTLVELVCAIAILSIVGLAATGIVVSSSKNYTRGTTEVSLQKDAQLLANMVSDLCQDADTVEEITGGLKITKGSEVYEVVFDSAANVVRVNYGGESEVLAENVRDFDPDATDFVDTRTVLLDIKMEKNSRSFDGKYSTKNRNGAGSVSGNAAGVSITLAPSEVVLVPTETFDVSTLCATASDGSAVRWSIAGQASTGTSLISGVVTIGQDESVDQFDLIAESETRRADGITPAARKVVKIYVRRVNSVDVTGTLISGNDKKTGAVYLVTARPAGTNLDVMPGLPSDTGYKSAYNVDFSFGYSENGAVVGDTSTYFSVSEINDWRASQASDVAPHTLKVTLLKDMQIGDQLYVSGVAMHPQGTDPSGANTNKAGKDYRVGGVNIAGQWILNANYFDFDGARLMRGSDQEQGNFTGLGAIKNLMHSRYGHDTYYGQMYHRYREVTIENGVVTGVGVWTKWRHNPGDANDSNSINLRPDATEAFNCNKNYEVQMALVVWDYTENQFVWPVEYKPSAGEELNTTITNVINNSPLNKESFIIDEIIKKVTLNFILKDNGGNTIFSDVQTVGSASAPQALSKGNLYNFTLDNFAGIGANTGIKAKIEYTVEQLVDGAWVSVATYQNGDQPLYLNLRNNTELVCGDQNNAKTVDGSSNVFRVRIGAKNVPLTQFVNVGNGYGVEYTDYDISEEETGRGIYYFEFR